MRHNVNRQWLMYECRAASPIAGRRHPGFTLLEIMMALSLMSVVIIAFAAVFPSGYRLNFSNLNQSKAASLAGAIAQQISNAPLTVLSPLARGGPSNPLNNVAPALYISGVIMLADANHPNGLPLPPPTQPPSPPAQTNQFYLEGIYLNPLPAPQATPTDLIAQQVLAMEIYIIMGWSESRRNGIVQKSIEITTLMNNVMNQ